MNPETPMQPKLGDLFSRYLQRQAEAHEAGLATFNPGDVMPYEAGPVQPIDPKLAWDEAAVALGAFGNETGKLTAPPSWPQLVAGHEPAVALAFCVGNFPQLVRNFHMILQKGNLGDLKPQAGRPTNASGLDEFAQQASAKGKPAQLLLALGALRLAKQFEQAEKFIAANDAAIDGNWRAAWENEKAALAWHSGQADKARAMWYAQAETLPVLFNRGMADLFLGKSDMARAALTRVVETLPETSAWHHLAHVYLTLAQP